MSQGRAASAATVLFNLADYRVLQVVRDQGGARTVIVETLAVEAACPSCGVFTSSVHQRTMQRVRDVAFDGPVTVVWREFLLSALTEPRPGKPNPRRSQGWSYSSRPGLYLIVKGS